ncbi:MAG TPA: CHASE4 domain-containing protein, partial [Steroidobacteraceae bacterium]|nr:CHASE4 domain-containing protein [Steroidobacteraceae bacterium]
NLSGKVVLLVCGLFATYGAIDYLVQREVILPSFERLEADLARTDMERVSRALDSELSQLLTFCGDWGNWLETYRYMAGENPSFIETNMNPATIDAAGLDAVAFLDPAGRIVWSRAVDPVSRQSRSLRLVSGSTLTANHRVHAAIAAGRTAKGIISTEFGPAMLVAAPILDGNGTGPARGTVLLVRVITPRVAARLGSQAQVHLAVLTDPHDLRLAPARSGPEQTVLLTGGEETFVYRVVRDLAGAPAMALRIDVPRSVTRTGRDAFHFAIASLAVAGLVAVLALVLALRHLVLGPVSRMTGHAVAIAEGDDLTRRIGLDRNDELGVLAGQFDRMVERLAETRRRLVDQSFEAGAAQVANGLLHNIGNAMTPMAVTIAEQQQRLQAAPVAELELAIGELESVSTTPARRADLERFLVLVSRELARTLERSVEDAELLGRQSDAIQRILAHQLRASSAGPALETVQLADLVARACELVPPALRRHLEVQCDDSLTAAGSLMLPRITLQQVFQNVIQNAAEAVRDSRRPCGRLHISARRAVGENSLTLRFSDDGPGIHAADLPRVFEKGFSTKPGDANFGIGLHWCANAITALGGRMRAHSAGPGLGATLEVVLPLGVAAQAA